MLKQLSSHKCHVIRDGKKQLIDAKELVVGDLIYLESGNSIPADIRIIECNNLTVDESSITGESRPVRKSVEKLSHDIVNLGDKLNMGYMSTLVVSGKGRGVVVACGMKSEIGKIADLLKDENNNITPLQKRLLDLGKLLGILTVAICFFMFVIALVEQRDVLDMLISSISLAVAAIPKSHQ